MEEQLIDLIQEDLDGTISQDARDRLREILRRNPQAGEYYHELESMFKTLSGLAWIEPPSGLRSQIMQNLSVPSVKVRGLGEPGSKPVPHRYRLLPLAAGIALGIVLYSLLLQVVPQQDRSGAVATMIDPAAVGRLPVLDRQTISAPGLQGSIQLRASAQLAAIEIELNADGALPVTLQFDDSQIRLSGFTQAGGRLAALDLNQDTVELKATSPLHTILFFSRDSSSDTSPQLDWQYTTWLTIHLAWP